MTLSETAGSAESGLLSRATGVEQTIKETTNCLRSQSEKSSIKTIFYSALKISDIEDKLRSLQGCPKTETLASGQTIFSVFLLQIYPAIFGGDQLN